MRTYVVLVAVLLGGLATLASGQSDRQLMDRYDRLYAGGKHALALKAAEELCERHPGSGVWAFNAGALCARLGEGDRAVAHLRRCADNGYSGIASFEQNTDLDPIREREDFRAVLETVRAAAQKRLEAFEREARRHEPATYAPEADAGVAPPLIIALHGTGMTGRQMYDALAEAAAERGAMLIAPDGLRPSGEGFAWTYRDEAAWFVHHLIDRAVEAHGADPSRVILLGFSQGANIALIMGQTEPERFLAVVPICGHYEAQVTAAEGATAPFYLMTGARDPWRRTYGRAKRDLEARGGVVETRVLAGQGHALPRGRSGTREYLRAIDWALSRAEEEDG